ncbi:hypothetical protein GCM10023091_25310 [Ravibacter arvi]|uniref:histidine kinase n=1 Tax=Ravibacter arvi TaxID=2051041 RepID=A0ABP8LZ51_9BACT
MTLCILQGAGLYAQKPGSGIVLGPYERFLNIRAEYKGAVASGDTALIAEKSYLIAKRYHDAGDYYEARKWLFKALKLQGEKADPVSLTKIYGWLGRCEAYESHWEGAVKYSRIALAFARKSGDEGRVYRGGAYLAVGQAHLGAWREKEKGGNVGTFLPSLDSAFWYYEQARRFIDEEGSQVMLGVVIRFYGELLSESGHVDEGLDSLKKAIEILTAQGPKEVFNVVGTAVLAGEIYMKNGRLREAGEWLRKAHVLADTGNVRSYMGLAIVKTKLSEYYLKVGNWRRAYELDQEADSLSTKELEAYRKSSREGLELLHENELKAIELDASRKELKLGQEKAEIRSQLSWLIGGVMLVAILAGSVFYRLYRKYRLVSIENARLVREQSHRVKNNLQSVYNLLSLQMGQLTDPLAVAALEESLNRVDAITRVHRCLYEGSKLSGVELSTFVPDLVKGVLRSYEMGHTRQVYEIPEIWLHADAAIPLGLVISELVTNSCKYAFEGHRAPLLKIKCELDPEGNFNLEYSDNGPGFDRTGTFSSFGLKLIDLLAGQLKGEYTFLQEAGSVFRLKFKEAVKKVAVVKDLS